MNSTRKARIVGVLITAIAVWPLVHHGLVRLYDVNPWKLFGFAMYAVPHQTTILKIESNAGSGWTPFDSNNPQIQNTLRTYADRHSALGRLASPRKTAEFILHREPHLQAIRFSFEKRGISRTSARYEILAQHKFEWSK